MGDIKHPANEEQIQSEGRKDNAAQPLNAAPENAGAERYPSTKKDDAIEGAGETRSFDPKRRNPAPPQGAGDGGPTTGER